MRNSLPILGNLSYVALASGFFSSDMLSLRIALVGGYTGLVLFHAFHPRPLRIPLRWSALFVVVNLGAAGLLLADRYTGGLSDEDARLYEEHFSMLTPGQFTALLALGTKKHLKDGTRLTTEGVHSDELYFVLSGHARLYHLQNFAAYILAGGFVNDVAFAQVGKKLPPLQSLRKITGGGRGDILGRGGGGQDAVVSSAPAASAGAYGTVVARGPMEVLVWEWDDLLKLLADRPEMDVNMRYCLTEHLVKGLLQQKDAAHLKRKRTKLKM